MFFKKEAPDKEINYFKFSKGPYVHYLNYSELILSS